MKIFVEAIRADQLVGRGTCSSIDECWSDDELAELVKDCASTKEAIELAQDQEELWLEEGLNARWGEDTDPELKIWNEWKKKRAEKNPNR